MLITRSQRVKLAAEWRLVKPNLQHIHYKFYAIYMLGLSQNLQICDLMGNLCRGTTDLQFGSEWVILARVHYTWTMSCFSISMYIINIAMPRSLVLARWLRHLFTIPEHTSPAVLSTAQANTSKNTDMPY